MKDGVHDWDSPESLSISDMVTTLNYIQQNGTFPVSLGLLILAILLTHYAQPGFDSKEDRNDIGPCPVAPSTIAALKSKVAQWALPGQPGHGILDSSDNPLRMCILDGFLLYAPSMSTIQPHMDIKFFLRVSYERAKARREARSGYATIEGFWEDPPGYVDKIVWPNYVHEHSWMFADGNVEGRLKEKVLKEWNIYCQSDKGVDVDMETTLKWTVDVLMKQLQLRPQK